MPETSSLDLTTFAKSVARLREAVASYSEQPEDDKNLDSIVKRFELAYELARNTMVRFLRKTSVELKEKPSLTFAYVVRTANQDGLLAGTWREWSEYRDMRNSSAHAYNEPEARKIAARIPAFLEEAEFLLQRMREKLEEDQDDAGA